MKTVVLAGGVGGGRFARAVVESVAPADVTVVGNVGDDLEVLGPYIPLAGQLGRLAMELAHGRAAEIVLTYFGGLSDYDTRLLTVAALNGAFQGRVDQPVNYVNAPVIAA